MSDMRAKIIELTNSGVLQSEIAERLGIGLGAIRYQLQLERGTHKPRNKDGTYKSDRKPPKYTPCIQVCLNCRQNFKAWDRKLNRICAPCKVED